MYRSAVSLLALVAALPAFADEVTVQAPVAAVTVYPDGAELTRRASAELPAGTHTVFLPYAGLDDLSALPRIATSEGVTIGTLGFRRDMSVDREALFTEGQAAAWAEVERLTDAADAAADARAAAAARLKALEARLAFLDKVEPGEAATAESVLALAASIADQVAEAEVAAVEARAALRPLDDAIEEATAALKDAQAAFDRLSPPAETADMISVEVTLAAAGPVTLELTELASYAWWEMDYDIDLDRDAGALEIDRKVIVAQNTGEVWSDVALTLSTARPGEAVSPAPVFPDQARIEEPRDLARATAAPMSLDAMEGAYAAAPEPVMEAEMKTASMQLDGLALSYVYPEPVTVASNEAAELALDTLDLEAEPMIWASPRRDETAFTVARFTNTTEEPILPGMANILRDGHLVGRQPVEMIPAGAETEMGFGPIEGLRLATIFERNAEGDTGIISRSNTREQKMIFTVENLTGEPQALRAFFPLPYSEQEDLRVRVTASPEPDETDIERARGVSAWDMSVAPGETAEVTITVALDWPEGMDLYWYP